MVRVVKASVVILSVVLPEREHGRSRKESVSLQPNSSKFEFEKKKTFFLDLKVKTGELTFSNGTAIS